MQTEHNTVKISWTAPTVPPADGYLLTTGVNNNINTSVSTPPYTATIPTRGVHNVRVMSLSRHLPGRMVEIQFVINGKL